MTSPYVRIHRTGTGQQFVCRRDQAADQLTDSGWFTVDDTTTAAVAALGRVLTGTERRSSAGLQAFLGVTVTSAAGFIAERRQDRDDDLAPPAWCEPGVQPDSHTDPRGGTVVAWDRSFGSGEVWLTCTDRAVDGRVRRSATLIGCEPAHDRMTAGQARMFAAALLNAADALDEPTAGAVPPK